MNPKEVSGQFPADRARQSVRAAITAQQAFFPIVCLLACIFACGTGCASKKAKNKQDIIFSDADEVRAALESTSSQPQAKHLDRADQLKIEQMIYGYLLERHFWDLADYSAVFLQAEDAQVNAMIKMHPNHNPPIKQTFHASVQAHRAPVDKDTDKPAMILSADVNEPNPDDSVDAIGRWYAGDAVTGFRAFHFVKTAGEWQIAEVR